MIYFDDYVAIVVVVAEDTLAKHFFFSKILPTGDVDRE
jgi:hypothetical protein